MYSIDFRRKVFSVKAKKNLSIRAVAKHFDIGVATVTRWNKRISPKPLARNPRTINYTALKEDVKKHPDSYCCERAQRLGVSKTGIFKAMKRLSITYKKNLKSSKSQRRGTYIIPKQD